MKDNIKVLYIHGFRIFGEGKSKKLIESAVGKKNLMVVGVKQKRVISSFIIFLLFIISVMVFNIYISYRFADKYICMANIILSAIVVITIFFIGSQLILYQIMKKSIKQAERKLQAFNPDVIVGIYFGAVVAMSLNCRNDKRSLVLVSPSVKQFQKFTHISEPNLSAFPYVIIVNGSKDNITPTSVCEKLISTTFAGNGRLEIVDDDHCYSKLKVSDFKTWIKEAKYKPSTCVLNIAKQLKDDKTGNKFVIDTPNFNQYGSLENGDYKESDPLV